jgi:thymidylate synthase
MRIIKGRNVNDLYTVGRGVLDTEGLSEETRNGTAFVMPCPVVSVYTRPQERVLFDHARDCNPFFHLFESLWMLAGRQDATWLDQFVGDFSARYGEADGHMHGAYGYRWRRHFRRYETRGGELCCDEVDQLSEIIRLLRANKRDRQAVIQMWDAEDDLGIPGLKDRPCNTQLYVRVREDINIKPVNGKQEVLDLTICCRSNDVIWGAYGANAVHMSILMEYLAAGVGVRMGTMYQISNNFHGYVDVLGKKPYSDRPYDPYYLGECVPKNMIDDFEAFDDDVKMFVSDPGTVHSYRNSFFYNTAYQMFNAHQAWRTKQIPLMESWIHGIESSDWHLACRQWLNRRKAAAAARAAGK